MRIVYQSFGGRYSDNPRALYEALTRGGDAGIEHVWLAEPAHLAAFPPGAQTVEYGSPEGVALLESADALVANTHTEFEWTKPSGLVYLQTWHGTPLKRIHWDVLWAPEGRLERLQRDVDRWDILVSPNHASSEFLRGAFHFEGDVVETGYPRNDILSAPERDEVRARVRAELGIADGVKAVLYAPTWRDDVVFSDDDGDIALHLDVEELATQLGGDHCLLLRLHYMLTGRMRAVEHPSVRDVSWYTDIRDLYLAADVLVTDYSSVMFDFAVTGKPILFYVYDLAHYRDELRGFYFDFVPDAPGPLLETTPDLIDAMRDLAALTRTYEDPYARFQARFCHLEDGHASDRVIERLFRAARPAVEAPASD